MKECKLFVIAALIVILAAFPANALECKGDTLQTLQKHIAQIRRVSFSMVFTKVLVGKHVDVMVVLYSNQKSFSYMFRKGDGCLVYKGPEVPVGLIRHLIFSELNV